MTIKSNDARRHLEPRLYSYYLLHFTSEITCLLYLSHQSGRREHQIHAQEYFRECPRHPASASVPKMWLDTLCSLFFLSTTWFLLRSRLNTFRIIGPEDIFRYTALHVVEFFITANILNGLGCLDPMLGMGKIIMGFVSSDREDINVSRILTSMKLKY